MFEQALKSPRSYLYYAGKVEIPYVGETDIDLFHNCKSGTFQMGIYKLSEDSMGYWSGSCLNIGIDKNWYIRIVKSV